MFRLLSIDPGSTNMGYTVFEVTSMDQPMNVLHTGTLNVERLAKLMYGDSMMFYHGLRQAKMQICHEAVYKLLHAWEITYVVSESPYMSRFPQAYGALMECLMSIRQAVMRYYPELPLALVDPATVKLSVGVKGNSGDKNHMTEAVARLYGHQVNVNVLDEHAIDSIAVGHAWQKQENQLFLSFMEMR